MLPMMKCGRKCFVEYVKVEVCKGTLNGVLISASNKRGKIREKGCNDDDDKQSKVGIEIWGTKTELVCECLR